MNLPKHVVVREVGPRDGFQIEKGWIPTDKKIAVVNALSECGLPIIEVTSFTHPKWVPQMRDAEEVMAAISRRPGTRYVGLVPNVVGARRAIAAGVEGYGLSVSASDTHQRKNFNMSIEETFPIQKEIFQLGKAAGLQMTVGIAMAFGCPLEGDIPPDRVLSLLQRFIDLTGGDLEELGLADTSGMANPRQVEELVGLVRKRFPGMAVGLHIHDTRGMGLANILAGLHAGATRVDASLGGMGGCPYAPGATGNVSTEDLVHMLHDLGIETGIDLDRLLAAGKLLEDVVGHPLHSAVVRAGTNKAFRDLPLNLRAKG